MKDYVIITDSCSDLPIELVNDLNIEIVPLSVELEDKTYLNYPDEREITHKDFYDKLRNKKVAKTSQVNASEFIEYFSKYLKQGKDILFTCISSALSGTFNSARLAKEELIEEFPERKIVLVDSLSASMGLGLFVYNAVKLKQQGKPIEEVAKWMEDNKLNICHFFTVGDLGTLKRGGRLSASVALIGTLLRVKPVLHVNNEGKLVPISKARGRKTSLDVLISNLNDNIINPKEQTIFISHGDCIDEAIEVGEKIKETYGVKEIIYGYIGPVIGAHAGPDTIALFFIGNKR